MHGYVSNAAVEENKREEGRLEEARKLKVSPMQRGVPIPWK